MKYRFAVLLLVVGTALGVPVIHDAEDVQCNSLFQYKKQYSFSYTGTTETGIIGTEDVTSNTRVTCQNVAVRVPQKCVVVLSLRSCSISPSTEQTRAFASNLERYELMARVNNGLISEVLPHVDESVEALNLKRGVLSALQMEFHGQIDEKLSSRQLSIHGNCSTVTTHVAHEGEYQEDYVVKRDLSGCTQRPTKTPMLWRGLGYLQNLDLAQYLINSSQVCHYETYNIKGQHMQHAMCKEIHSFWPGSISSDRGIMTTITQELGPMVLDKMNSVDFKADRYEKRSTSIIQEIPKDEAPERITTEEAMEFIKPLVGSTLDEVKVESPRMFSSWVKALRSLDNDTIHEVFEQTYNCKDHSEKCRTIPGKAELAREYLWDGLIQCGTLECFAVVNTAIIKNIVPKPLAHVMMYTMAFRDYPTLDIIAEGVRLARVNRTRSVILPISTVIYRYWLNNPEIHSQRELPVPINEFIDLMNDIINNDCTLTSQRGTVEAVEEEHQILLAIKAIGNLGPVAQKYDESEFKKRAHFERELLRCAANADVSFNVSLSSIQALRRFNMSTVSSFVIDSMKAAILETTRDVEIRIALYLIYMQADLTAPELRDLYVALKTEPSKQFQAFTLSHISNILESEDPTVQVLRRNLALAIGEEELPDYPKNIFKYSRNIEISKLITLPYFDRTFGGSIQSNIIYNSNAVMPKSLMIKTAVNALGNNWELVENGLEIQGFEVIAESIFGPAGFFPSNVMKTVFRKADEAIMSKIRSSSISLDWLANALDILMSPIENFDSEKMTKTIKKKITDMTNSEPAPEPEPEVVPENLLPQDVEENLADIHEAVNKGNKEKIAAVYLRILGNELGYLTLDDIKGLIPVLNKQTLVDMYNKISEKLAEGVDVNTTRSIVFLERQLVLPTGIGMPLNCSANGTVMISVRSRGQLSISLPTASVSGRIAPSAALELVGTMGVHVPTTKIYSAVMANASVYHNSEIEATASLDGGAVKVHLKPVKRSLNIIKVALDYYLLKPDGEVKYIEGIMQDAVQYEKCLTTGRLLGASLCLSFRYPNASLAEIAPRFPLTGPVRFSLTLDNADESLEGYTFEAKYKKIVKGGTTTTTTTKSKPTKKSFGKIGKTTATPYVTPEEVIDTILVSFSAPGAELLRNVTTMMTFNRNKTEAKWTFDVPELDGFKLFAGALNLSDDTGSSGMHFVWNATVMEKEASVSLTLKNSSVVDHTNYTGVFNASIQQLYFSAVAQHINSVDFMISSFNYTYPWDEETPLYDQLTFPVSGYTVRPEVYRSCMNLFKTHTNKRVTESMLFLSHFGQNFTVESEAFTTRDSYVNEISSKFENQYTSLPLADFTYQFDDETRNKIRLSSRYLDVHRGDHSLYYQEDGERDVRTNTMTRNYTFGVKSVQKIMRSAFEDIDDPILLSRFQEEELYDFKPVNLNTTLHFVYVNETELVSPASHFTSFNMTVSVPRSTDLSNQTRWGIGSTVRFVNEESTPEKSHGFVLQVNHTIPILLLDFSNEVSIRNTTQGLNMSFSHQSMERKYGKHMNVDMFNNIDILSKSMQNGINFTSPYYNYSGSFMVVMDEIQGLVVKNVMEQKGGVMPDITDFLHNYYITVKLWQNASIGFDITNRLFNISTNHMINLDGPVTEFEMRMVPFWVRDFINKTVHGDIAGMATSLREVSYKITNSSMMVGNDLMVRMPYIFNVTMDHDFFIDMDMVNHTMIVLVKRPGVNFNVNYMMQGPDEGTGFYTLSNQMAGNVGTITDMMSTVTGKAKFGKSLNSNLVMTTTVMTPMIANTTMTSTFTIKGMKEMTRFDSIELVMETNTESILGTSNMMARTKFDTFKKLFKFSKSEAMMTANVASRFLNVDMMTGIEASGFNDMMEFTRMNTTATVTVTSPVVNATLNSISEVNNVEKAFVVGSMVSTHTYHVESMLGNADSTVGWEVMDVRSPMDFQRSNGSTAFTMTSRMVNVTTSQSMDFQGVQGMFTFEKVGGKMNWNAVTMMGDVTVSQLFELNNFVNVTVFERAMAGANMVMTSDYLGDATVMGKMGVHGCRGLMVMDEVNMTIDASMGTPWVEASLTSTGKIKRMTGMFKSKAIIGKTRYMTTSRILNVTGDMSSTTKNMDGLFNIDTMDNSWTHTASTPITKMNIDVMSEMSGVNGIMTHALISNTINFNWTTPVGVMETSFVQFRENAASLFTVEMTSVSGRTAFTSKLFNMTMEGAVVGDGFLSFFNFREFTTAASTDMSIWKIMDVRAAHSSATTNMASMTSLDKFTMTQNATVTTPIATVEMTHEANMLNWRSMFSCDQFATFGNINMISRLLNTTNAMVLDMTNRDGMFTFGTVRYGMSNNVTTPLSAMQSNLGFEILNMVGLTQSTKIAAGLTTSMTNKLVTMNTAAGLKMLGQASMFVFDNIGAGANMTMVTPMMNMSFASGSEMIDSQGPMRYGTLKMGSSASVNTTISTMKVEGGIEVRDQTGVFAFRKASMGSMAMATNRLVNMTMGMETLVLNHEKLMHFDVASHNASFNLVTKYETMDHGYQMVMRNSAGLFKSEIVEVAYDGTNAGIIDTTSKFSATLTGNNGLGVYTKLQINHMMDLTTKIINGTTTNVFTITNAKGLMRFVRGAVTSGTMITVPFGSIEMVNTVDMEDFRGPMNFTSMMMNGRINGGDLLTATAGAEFMNFQGPFVFDSMMMNGMINGGDLLTATAGVEFMNFQGPFVFDRWNASMMMQTINRYMNLTQNSAVGVVNSRGLFAATKAFLTTGSTSTSIIGTQTSILSLEVNEMESLRKFTKINATAAWDVDTILISSISGSTLLVNNVRGIFDFDQISMVSTTGIVSKPANATVNFMYLLNDVTGFMKFGEMLIMGNTTAQSIVGDIDTAGTMSVTKMRGLLKLDALKIGTTTTMTGPLSTFELSGNVLVRKVVNITSFKLVNSGYSIDFVSMPMNITSTGEFRIEASNSIFDVALIEGSMVTNISAPLIGTNASSSMVLRDMTSLRTFGEIGLTNEMRTITPLTDSSVAFTVGGETSWANVVQRLDTSVTTPAGTVEVAQFIDYENAKISITLPSYAYIHLHGHLSEIGDEMTIKIKHALEGQELVEDLSLLLKLNESNIVYTNFSWNPEVVAELMDISVDALNRTVNYTLTMYNNTKENLKQFVNLTRETIKELNATVREIMENPRDYIQQHIDLARLDALKEKIEELKIQVQDMVKFILEDPKQAVRDFYEVLRATVEKAKEIARETYEKMDQIARETYEKMDEQLMIREKIDRLNETLQDAILYISYPKETWELVKPKLEEYLLQIRESIKYDLIKVLILEIVDVQRINVTIREYLEKVNIENLKARLEDVRLLINSTKVQEVYDAIMSVEVNVGCVTFKDLAAIDMEKINSTYIKIKEFIMVENLKQFINVSKIEEITDRINQTLRENMDIQVWNETLRSYVNVPLLKIALEDLSEYIKIEVNMILETIKEKVELKVEELKARYAELQEMTKEAIQLLKDTLIEVSGMNWVQLKEKIQVITIQFNENLHERLNMEKIKEVLLELKANVTSRINMTKIDAAIEQLNNTLFLIIDATKNETHPINMLPMRFAETTIFDFLNTTIFDFLNASLERFSEMSDEYGEITFELIKEYGQKGKEQFDIYKAKAEELFNKYLNITKEKSQELYEKAREQYDIYSVKTRDLVGSLIEVSKAKIDKLQIQLNEKLVELNETLRELYEEQSPRIYDFVFNATEFGMNYTRNFTQYLIEKSMPLVEKSLEFIDTHKATVLERLTAYKNEMLLQSEDMCINITTLVEKTIEKLPEYKEQLLDLTEEYKVIAREFYQELYKNITYFKDATIIYAMEQRVLLEEFRDMTWAQVIEIAKNEENLLNYYPTEWTGRTVHVLSEETVEYLKTKAAELREKAELKYEDLKNLADAKVEEMKVILADPTNRINRIPIEFLDMTLLEIYDEVKQNVTELVEQGKTYIEVAKVFINESIITLNETRLEYNVTVEHLQDLITEFVDNVNASLNVFADWVEVAKQQPYNVTMNQIVDYTNRTLIQVLDNGRFTFNKTIDLTNQTLVIVIELWNNLTSQESLDRIPVFAERVFDLISDTVVKINETIRDTIGITKRVIEIVKEETGFPERLEEFKVKLEELKVKLEEYRVDSSEYLTEARAAAKEYLILTKEYLNLTKEAVFDRSIGYVEYLNNTLPGWLYRYYRMDAMPFEMLNYTFVKANETMRSMVNTTMVFIDDVTGRFVEFNLDHNSFTVNFTHPFHWTSFREVPRLTDAQIDVLIVTREEIMNRLVLPSQYQIERLSELIKTRYTELMDYISVKIEENRPQVEAKLEELREKIKETRKQIEMMREEFSWTELKQNITERYDEAREYLRENVPIFIDQLKENAPIFVDQLKGNATVIANRLRENATVIMTNLKENVTYFMDEIKDNYPAYIEKAKEIKQNITDLLQRYQEEFPETMREILQRLSNITRELYLPTDLSPLIKPWTYTSMIFGERHVMTFDKLVYEHPGYLAEGCTYLLARDFVDGNFSIVVTEQTTTLHVKDSFSVRIGPGKEFFINGDGIPASPPFVTKDLRVVRDGPWINVTTTHGISVFCQTDLFMCAYELSGWYYHKTQGLLGNLDTEHHNEMIKPDGTVTQSVIDWFNSYELTGRPECIFPDSYVAPAPNCPTSSKITIKARCEALFNSTESPLHPIYGTICPKSFLKECKEVDAEKCVDVNELVDNYRTLGAIEGIFVDMPGCANTDLAEPCIYDRPVVIPADVVFIVSESWRMLADVSEADLKQNLNNLYVSIRTNYPDSNFALVAYGGNEYEHCAPHLHSNEMEFFSGANYERAINSLEFCEQETCSCSPKKGDALKAIEYASHLRLRDNAGKIFILIDNFEKDYEESERLAAADILADNTIIFNSISTYSQLEKTIGKVPIIGINYNGQVLFNKRNSAETITETLDTPKGVFAKLATATDGAMIGFNYLTDEVHSLDIKQVLKKTFRTQLEAYEVKTVQCQSIRDIYGRPSSRCIEI